MQVQNWSCTCSVLQVEVHSLIPNLLQKKLNVVNRNTLQLVYFSLQLYLTICIIVHLLNITVLVVSSVFFVFQDKLKQFQERLAEERRNRLEERKKQRKEERRITYYREKEEEEQRLREEQLLKGMIRGYYFLFWFPCFHTIGGSHLIFSQC